MAETTLSLLKELRKELDTKADKADLEKLRQSIESGSNGSSYAVAIARLQEGMESLRDTFDLRIGATNKQLDRLGNSFWWMVRVVGAGVIAIILDRIFS